MRALTRHLLAGYGLRAVGLAGIASALGLLVGWIEQGNRPAGAIEGSSWLVALARAPEVVFFASPVIAVLAVLWTARDLVPPGVVEGLGGAGVPEARVDHALGRGAALVLVATMMLGSWLAPLAQRAATVDPRQAWERSGGAPEWAQEGWTWLRVGEVLARVSIDGDRVVATRAIGFGPEGPFDVPVEAWASGAAALPDAADVRLLATPPALLTVPELLRAGAVRSRYGHPTAPTDAELALRWAILLLTIPATATGLACRRIRRATRRWSMLAGFVVVAMLGVQVSHVWATRGELPVWSVVLVPFAAGSVVAVAGWRMGGRREVNADAAGYSQ